MQLVSDSGFDLSDQQKDGLSIHTLPLKISLNGMNYLSGVDIQSEEFYQLLEHTQELPLTSVPSPGDFINMYQKLAEEDPNILSVHISSGLSGTYNAALSAAAQLPDINITLVDTLSLSAEMGWQVEAAARAIKANWSLDKILDLLTTIRKASEMVFTLPDLTYLIHGGRISHLKGLLASVLGIKPIIGVDKKTGKYNDLIKVRSFKRAIKAIPEYAAKKFREGTLLKAQIGHAGNPEGAVQLREAANKILNCEWLPDFTISPVLGAHTGRGLVGLLFAPADSLPTLP